MFIARENELNTLQKLYSSSKFEFPVIYGRRRIGKTTLVQKFIEDKRAVFFTATESTARINLDSLAQTIHESIEDSPELSFPSFEAAFRYIDNLAKDEPLIFVIDEYPYLAKSDSSVSSVLQKTIDTLYLKNPHLMLILSGSSMSFMEKQVLGYESPLYGRRTAQFKLEPFSLEETQQMLPRMSAEDLMTIWGVTGGIPLYISQMQDSLTLKENLLQNFFVKNTLLYDETKNLLNQELRTPARYQSILQAVANGNTKINTIAQAAGIEITNLTAYINGLIELEILEKNYPLGEESNNKKVIYHIKDGLFRFYYQFVPKYQVFIDRGQYELLWNLIQDELSQFTSQIFENFCREWLLLQNGQGIFNMLILQIGSWWGNNPLIREKKPEEIDILAFGAQADELLIGECKWRSKRTDIAVLNKLLERSNFFPHNKKELFIFSKSDFTETLIEAAKAHHIKLVNYLDMI